MIQFLDKDSLTNLFQFCNSNSLLALYFTNSKIQEIMNQLETSHISTNETKYRLQIYHPSYTIYLNVNQSEKLTNDNIVNTFINEFHFEKRELFIKKDKIIILERELLKESLLPKLEKKFKIDTQECLNLKDNHIFNEFNEFNLKKRNYLLQYYNRFTIRIIIGNLNHFRNFLSNEQVLILTENDSSNRYPTLRLFYSLKSNTSSSSGSMEDIRNLILNHYLNVKKGNNLNYESIVNFILLYILKYMMPKYYYEVYKINNKSIEVWQQQALVDKFYHELLENESILTKIPVFDTDAYIDRSFSLFQHALEICFDLLWNKLSLKRKMELLKKLIFTYLILNDFTDEEILFIKKFGQLRLQCKKMPFFNIEKNNNLIIVYFYYLNIEKSMVMDVLALKRQIYQVVMSIPVGSLSGGNFIGEVNYRITLVEEQQQLNNNSSVVIGNANNKLCNLL